MSENIHKDKAVGFYVTAYSSDIDNKLKTHVSNHPEDEGSFIHVCGGDVSNLYIGSHRVTDNFNVPDVDEKFKTIKVGGLEESTIGELKNRPISDILFNIVCPDVKPTVESNPSVTITYSGNTLISVGTTLPSEKDITITSDRGAFSTGISYAGEVSNSELTMTPAKWSEASEEGRYTISAVVTFASGEVPVSSHGNKIPDSQYKGGVASNSIEIHSVHPIYTNGVKISENQSNIERGDISVLNGIIVDYISGSKLFYIAVAEETDKSKFKLEIPNSISSYTVMQKNNVSGKYDIGITMVSDLSNTRDGYKCYVRTTDSSDRKGPSEYKIELKK